jgi:hypothetical protein
LGEPLEGLNIIFKQIWGPVSTVDQISFSIPVPSTESKKLLARRFGKSYTHDEKRHDRVGEQSYWLFRNGGVITLKKPIGDSGFNTRLVYYSPRFFASSHPYFIDRFGLMSMFDDLKGSASFDGEDI